MIQVKKSKDSAPPELEKKDSDGKTERQRAIEFFKVKSHRQETFPFKAYKSQAVRDKLDALFHKKCAYCESYYGATQPSDVEHFRPKGAVDIDGKRDKPGYYWLASDWGNLLPSCIDCNRQRGHGVDGNERVQLGKANKFPVKGKRKKLVPGVEKKEAVLLLHPCKDDPGKHLDFWALGMVRATKRGTHPESEKGKHSIEVFGLQRPGLVSARKQLWQRMRQGIKLYQRAKDDLKSDRKNARRKESFEEHTKALRSYLELDQPYLAMARQLLAREAPAVLNLP